MKKQIAAGILAILFSACPITAQAVHWMPLGDTEEGQVYMDRDSLKTKGENNIIVWEKILWREADSKGNSGILQHQEYDLKKKVWRPLSWYYLNSRGKKSTGVRKIGEWQPLQPLTSLFSRARYEKDYARLNGPWVFIKTLPGLGKKWFNPRTLEKKGTDTYEVWEKTRLRQPANRTILLLSKTRYTLQDKKAKTLYLCTFDQRGFMTDHYDVRDKWDQENDTYGEYIGEQLAAYYKKHHK